MVKLTVIASRKAKQSIAVHCQKLDCHGSLRNLAMTAKMPTPRHCGSLPKTGLPRFLAEPRNDSENANPSSLRFIAENWLAAVPSEPRNDSENATPSSLRFIVENWLAAVPYGTSQ